MINYFLRLAVIGMTVLLYSCRSSNSYQFSMDDVYTLDTLKGMAKEEFLRSKGYKVGKNEDGKVMFHKSSSENEPPQEMVMLYEDHVAYLTADESNYNDLMTKIKANYKYDGQSNYSEGETYYLYKKDGATLRTSTVPSQGELPTYYSIDYTNFTVSKFLEKEMPIFMKGNWHRSGDDVSNGNYRFFKLDAFVYYGIGHDTLRGQTQVVLRDHKIIFTYDDDKSNSETPHPLAGKTEIFVADEDKTTAKKIVGSFEGRERAIVTIEKEVE